MAKIIVDIEHCKGCGLCVEFCPQEIMQLNTEVITQKGYNPAHCIDMDECTACLSCAMMCPDVAIKVVK